MFRNQYDNDASTWSPNGRIFQVEYAAEAVKQGTAVVGLRSKDHAVLVAVKRSPNELASYMKKIIRIDDHMGIAVAGLTSDARVLSNYLRTEAMRSKMVYGRPLPVGRAVNSIGDKAQTNTQEYGRRPYGVGLLVIGHDDTGPHLYEFSPSGIVSEYYGYSIGARSQSARTNLERNFDSFENLTLNELIMQGLRALRDTIQQGKQLDTMNTSIGFVGKDTKMTILDGESTLEYLNMLDEGDDMNIE
ncbi:Proteasome subunit alpha type-6 [Coemansia sp. RSA 989]|nr:nucleophile aminohydrolase [Coemansia mojavensis]KAJ1739043.1 Proteasome subunit alpha type-6 [Coemansia sp. RSA 1086]KAJ1753071.1 Proteasome subunit alpha type-6 [Coemansia sp. RSA 1821]KAJ1868010.1 Proteasome subunit alpha type-6 [Coemansia sp. RSA 989]KAJ1875362.1 Proteasome subunit alpha type-6 [Coemansia sp. RSA 990]KAJ2633843.1 Proteasome subunit alpha type-6 [Coemansia sp. RSA 1290]KAJ2651497.1 Proteasome subunit alpha type-6 [Coemansia sp. RSA 1250]